MTTPMPGVTRYPLGRYSYRRMGAEALLLAFVFSLGTSVATALFAGAEPVTVLVVCVVGVVVPPATFVLPWWLRIAVVLATGVGLLSWSDGGEGGIGLVLTVLAALLAGSVLLLWLVHRRWQRHREAAAEGAAPSGRDPSGGKDVGVFATWRGEGYDYEAAEPSAEVVLDAVRALNGRDRSAVSVFHGRGRLDVGGDAGDRLVVMQSDDRRRWHMVVDPHQPEGKLPMVVAGLATHYPRQRTTTLPEAERAVAAWVERGEREPSLDWWADTALDQALRPRGLRLLD